MADSRKTWFQQEQEENRQILEMFWKMRVQKPNHNQKSIDDIKVGFLRAIPPEGVSGKEWEEKLDKAWADNSAFKNFETFWKFFEHVPTLKPIVRFEKLNMQEGNKPKQEVEAKISNHDLKDVEQYATERNLSIVLKIGSQKSSIKSYSSQSNTTCDVFSIHSLGKVFTGVLALCLIREGIISENDIFSIIQLDPFVKEKLSHAPSVLKRLEQVTLHQAMTHYAGLGDYLGNYIDKVKGSKTSSPHIETVNDLLQFVEDKTTPLVDETTPKGQRNRNYSNSGILLAGLSLEYLYNEHRKAHPEKELPHLDFNGLMERYVTGAKAANMEFTPFPPQDFKYNKKIEFAKHLAGGPAGGSFTSADDLQKFAKWLYDQCNKIDPKKPNFVDLITKYGQEFCPSPQNHTIEHGGDLESGSAYFSLNWENGNTIIVLNDQGPMVAKEVGKAINEHIYLQDIEEIKHSESLSPQVPHNSNELSSIKSQSIFSPSQRPSTTRKLQEDEPTLVLRKKGG